MKPQLKLINDAFDALRWAFDNETVNWANKLLDKCKEEERGHRGFMPDFARCHTADTINITQAAKLFAVKRVAEYLLGEKFPTGKDYLYTQKSCFIAAGMVDEYRDKIYKAWRDIETREIVALDYTDFVKTRTTEAA